MVSMAWGLRQSYTTSDIHLVSHTIPRADLQPGDVTAANNQIHHRLRRTDGTWTPWGHIGNPGNANALSTTTDPSQNLHVITAS